MEVLGRRLLGGTETPSFYILAKYYLESSQISTTPARDCCIKSGTPASVDQSGRDNFAEDFVVTKIRHYFPLDAGFMMNHTWVWNPLDKTTSTLLLLPLRRLYLAFLLTPTAFADNKGYKVPATKKLSIGASPRK